MSSAVTVTPPPRQGSLDDSMLPYRSRGEPFTASRSSSSSKLKSRTPTPSDQFPFASPASSSTPPRTSSRCKASKSKSRLEPLIAGTSSPKRPPPRAFLTPYSVSSDREGGGSSPYSSSTDTPGAHLLPPSPQLPYFDKYPKRSERLKANRISRDDLDDYRSPSSRLAASLRNGRPGSASGRQTVHSPAPSITKSRSSKDPDSSDRDDEERQEIYPFPSKVSPVIRSRRQFPPSSKALHSIQPTSTSSSPSTSPSSSPLRRPDKQLPSRNASSYHDRPKIPPFASSLYTSNDSSLNDGPLVISPGFDVTEMDALVDQMNGHRKTSLELPQLPSSPWDNVITNPGKSGGPRYHPLYHPPLPDPPGGVALGHLRPSSRSRPSAIDPSMSSRNTRSTAVTSSRPPTVVPTSSPPSLSRSSGNSDQSSLNTCTEQVGTDDVTLVNDLSRTLRTVPKLDNPPPPTKTVIPSITDIIRAHAPEHLSKNRSIPPRPLNMVPDVEEESEPTDSRSSVDSVAEETLRATSVLTKQSPNHTATFSHNQMTAPSRTSTSTTPRSPVSPSIPSPCTFTAPTPSNASETSFDSPTTSTYPSMQPSRPSSPTRELAQYLRSPRLTRLMPLRRPANAGVTVSFADVGSPIGHPLILFLGLGCVRYIVGLYDEMAEALNLRLVCIDRWGLGRTTEVPTERRGMLEWASVVEEVADQLGLEKFSIVAHSAGAPYALASALRLETRVHGSVHLLAPWVNASVDGGYKWLKYIPTSLIKTAQTAEWKMQAWKLGKPPSIAYEGIGFDVRAANAETISISAQSTTTSWASPANESDHSRPSINSSEYDDLADFNGQFGGHDGVGKTGNHHLTKKSSKSSFLGLFETKPKPKRQPGLARPQTSRTESLPSLDVSRAPGPERSLRSSKSKSSLKSAKGTSILSKAELPLPAIPLQEYSPVHLEFDISAFEAVEENSGTVRSKKTSVPTLESVSTMDRASGKRSLSLSPGPAPSRTRDGRIPPLPPLPTFAMIKDNGPPSPSFSTMSTPAPQTRHPNFSTRSIPSGSTTSSAGFSIVTASKGNTKSSGPSLASALLSASHAEALKGGSADLMAILERDSRPWGFSYTDVKQPVKVWYGDRDDRIGIGSVRWMERTMKDCTLKVLEGEGHGLLTNADVVVEVLESVAKEWCR
ncbi:uncharacterized protein EI90DRAFT_3041930 [Cantharellus anzutake]|uniref:uncharacterized protein n=1 Tax=Cantharellus anzutake TaxID=1750568 RepID=UPI0019068024|nr:uncharacterized protein EI90DRAFT_3041930 [Cantharellus anzutake]KAF8338171.1 hypothetical protein EI90DRAFT_3041930 [Cantharellus anzutake]